MQLSFETRYEAVRESWARDVPIGVWAHQGCPRGAIPAQCLFCGPLGVYGPRLQSLVPFGEGLYWVWPCSPRDWTLICLVSGPSLLGLMSNVYIVVFLVYFRHILCYSDMSSYK
jgi:hypothetical protein